MDSNPYESPSILEAAVSSPASTRRPRGIAILSVLAIIGGVILLFVSILMAASSQNSSVSFTEMGFPPSLVLTAIAFLAALTLASGIGMWRGLKWGWWLGCFYYVYAVFRNGSALLTISEMSVDLADVARGPEYYYGKYSLRIVFNLLLILYFFKSSVLEYFGLTDINKLKAIGFLVLTCIGISVAFTACAAMAS